jgi:hypothetical protein
VIKIGCVVFHLENLEGALAHYNTKKCLRFPLSKPMKLTADLLHIVLSPNVRAQLSLRDVWNELKPDLDVFPVDRSTHNRAIMECMLYAPTCGKSVCSAWDSSRITEQLESITFHNISPWDVFYYAWMSLDAWLAQVWVFKEWQALLRKRAWSFWTGQPAKWWDWWNRFFHVSMNTLTTTSNLSNTFWMGQSPYVIFSSEGL